MEAGRWDSLWFADHYLPPPGRREDEPLAAYEAFSLIAAAAGMTERLGLGHLVLGNTYRNPALVAKMATTVDQISHGRFVLGIGAAWFQREHEAYGWNFPSMRERSDRLEEACAMLRALFTADGPVDFDGHYYQFDALVNLYNEKFAKPATEVMTLIKKKGLLEHKAAFSNDIEWEYWELWHHEGRRARHGASMMSPDHTWWHGIYEVAHNFYFKFLPASRELDDPEVNALIDKVLSDPMHKWINRPTADIKEDIRSGELQEVYQQLFQTQ